MEKKRVRLLDLFNADSERYKDLSELYVLKVDIYKAKAAVNLILEGVESLPIPNSLVSLVEELENDFGTKVNFLFTGISEIGFNDIYDALSKLIKYYLVRDNEGGVGNMADFISLSADVDYDCGDTFGYVTYISIPSGWAMMFNDTDRENVKNAVRDASAICLGNEMHTSFEIMVVDPEVSGADIITEDDLRDALKDLKFEDFEEAPAETDGKKKGGKKKKSESELAAEAEAAGKNSWAFKAQQARKEAKQEEKKFDYKASANAENQLYGRVKKQATFMKIESLTVGCFDVNIAGDVSFNDDSFKLAKTGRSVIVKFMCLDDTDGISCIAFLKPEEADGFQKEFGKGGYVGIQGNVENDSFTGDKCLKVSGFYKAERPAKRKDNAPRKRVELHVHTKMSESDATTEPADLIKLAASFGHTACAVTDHGVVQAFPHVFEA